MQQRQQYWDILKGLGIIAVVIGHSGSPLVPFVYMYHIALFFFISGYFYKDAYSADPGVFIARRMKTLYWPFVKYGLGFLILHNALLYIGVLSTRVEGGIIPAKGYNFTDMLWMAEEIVTFRNTEQMAGAMWFLPSLFVTGVLFCLIRHASLRFAGRHALFVTGGLSLILFCLGIILAQKKIMLVMHADASLVAMPVFLAGYLANNYRLQFRMNGVIALLSAAFIVFAAWRFGFFEVVNQKYINPWLFISATCAGIYVNLYLARLIEKVAYLKQLFSNIGQASLAILGLHFLAFKAVSAFYIAATGAPSYWLARFPAITGDKGWWIAYTITGVGLPLLLRMAYVSIGDRLAKKPIPEFSA